MCVVVTLDVAVGTQLNSCLSVTKIIVILLINKNTILNMKFWIITLFDCLSINFSCQIRNTVCSQLSNICCVFRYTTCVRGYTTVSVDMQHVFVVRLDVAVGENLNSCVCGYTTCVPLTINWR